MEDLTIGMGNLALDGAKTIQLIGSDGHTIEVPERVIMSPAIKKMVDDAHRSNEFNGIIHCDTIKGCHLNLMIKALKTIDRQAICHVQTDYNDNRHLLYWLNKIKPTDYDSLYRAFQLCDLSLLATMIETQQLRYLLRQDSIRDVKPYIAQFVRDDARLQVLKQQIIEKMGIVDASELPKELPSYHNEYSAKNRWRIEIYKNDMLIKILKIPTSVNFFEPAVSCDGTLCVWRDGISHGDEGIVVKIVDLKNGVMRAITGHAMDNLCWSPNNKWLVGCWGNDIKILNIETNKCVTIRVELEYPITVAWLSNSMSVIKEYYARPSRRLKIVNIELIFQISDYFENGIKSLEEISLLKSIDQKHQSGEQYILSAAEHLIFNDIAKDNQAVGQAIRNALSDYSKGNVD